MKRKHNVQLGKVSKKRLKWDFNEWVAHIESLGFKLVEDTRQAYENRRKYTKVICPKGHEWSSRGKRLEAGCPQCNHRHIQKHTLHSWIEHMKKFGVRLVNPERDFPQRNHGSIEFICEKGHIFWRNNTLLYTYYKKQKNICPVCTGRKKGRPFTFEEWKTLVELNGYELVYPERDFPTRNKGFYVKCKNGHLWKTYRENLKTSGECSKCPGNRTSKLLFEDWKTRVESFGLVLPHAKEDYPQRTNGFRVMCTKGHKYVTWLHNIERGCSMCNAFSSEATCRAIMEFLFGTEFPKVRPQFLNGLELDGYNEDLKLAFEYNGIQHYKEIPYFHRVKGSFKRRLENDAKKKFLCEQHGIHILIIPYTVEHANLYTWIREHAPNVPCDTPEYINYAILDICSSHQERMHKNINRWLQKHRPGYTFIGPYTNYKMKMLFECDKGHQYWSLWRTIYEKYNCPLCAKQDREEKNRQLIANMETMDDIKMLDPYIGNRSNIWYKFLCLRCGEMTTQKFGNMLKKKTLCCRTELPNSWIHRNPTSFRPGIKAAMMDFRRTLHLELQNAEEPIKGEKHERKFQCLKCKKILTFNWKTLSSRRTPVCCVQKAPRDMVLSTRFKK